VTGTAFGSDRLVVGLTAKSDLGNRPGGAYERDGRRSLRENPRHR